MMNLDWLRTLVVGGAVVATLGSATSSSQPPPSGYYPQPSTQPQAQPHAQPQSPPHAAPQGHPAAPQQASTPPPRAPVAAAPSPNTCEGVCDQIVRCNVGGFDDCMQECAKAGATPDQLATLARSSCEQLSAMAQEPAPPPAPAPAPQPTQAPTPTPAEGKRTQWVCNASGMWQKCESQGFSCYPSTTTMLGFGPDEPAARANAVSVCSTAMSRMMSVNFAYRTSVTSPCRVMMCTPPNAK